MCFVFFFKSKTAYEMRISDWSSDVCSSDLRGLKPQRIGRPAIRDATRRNLPHRPRLFSCPVVNRTIAGVSDGPESSSSRGGDRRPRDARHGRLSCRDREARPATYQGGRRPSAEVLGLGKKEDRTRTDRAAEGKLARQPPQQEKSEGKERKRKKKDERR